MSFLLQRMDGRKTSLLEVKSSRLRIGRGTDAQLRSDNAAVALEHAVIEERAGIGYELSDLGSITGTYVNGRPTEIRLLAAGDTIEIGDLILTVQVADPERPLFVRVQQIREDEDDAPVEQVQQEEQTFTVGTAMRAPSVDFSRAYRLRQGLLSKRSLTISLLVIMAVGVAAFTIGEGSVVYQPGPLSVAHATATKPNGGRVIPAHDCRLCHEPFGGASNARCNDCHRQLFHQASRTEVGPCIDCHAEHRQIPQLSAVQEQECIRCHARLEGGAVTVARTITGFERDHPQFNIVLADEQRVPVRSEVTAAADNMALKFSHDCHMFGDCNVRPPSATDPRRVKIDLECVSCHSFDEETGAALAVEFDRTCAGCHPLTFDNRFAPVPHGVTLEAVAGVIANAYAGNDDLLTRSPEEISRIFASGKGRTTQTGALIVRNAQRVMRVRCEQCHLLAPGGRQIMPVGTRNHSWFGGMKRFDHNRHLDGALGLDCVDCHKGAEHSRSAATLSLPGVEDCSGCHRASDKFNAGLGTCTTCHFYHEATERLGPGWTARASLTGAVGSAAVAGTAAAGDKQGGGWVFFIGAIWTMLTIGGVIVIALVIVAAIAAFTAARRERRETGRALSELTTDQPPARRAPPKTAPEAPAPPRDPQPVKPAPVPAPEPAAEAPEPEKTVAVPLAGSAEETKIAGGTMMIEWHGSLIGLSGPLEGKRLPVSSGDGFFIGRDKAVSQVVVDDNRVSRRHVWIGVEGEDVVAVDQGSTNGTFVNGERIERRILAEGDILTISDQVVSLKYES